jgi:hypothetical protein
MNERMIKLLSDELNKKGIVFPIKTLEEMLNQSYENGTPSCISHDYLRPFAWVKPKGLLLDPISCSVIGKLMIPNNEEESKGLSSLTSNYITEKHFKVNEDIKNEIIKAIKIELSKDAQFINFGFTGVIDKDIVRKLFPEIFEHCDKDGLINYFDLNSLVPGVFQNGELIFFPHQYFRRNYSRLNNLNDDFFMCLEQIRNEKCSTKIAIDPDIIGLKSSFLKPLEFEYWWGPKFNDSLKKIPLGVTCYNVDDRLRQFHQIHRTEFFWNVQDNHKTFECEEISDLDVKDLGFIFGCRYIHSMLDKVNETIIHLDGAIRGYNNEQMIKRLGIDISKQEKDLLYTKLWRIDGDIPKKIWKELICHFYRDNYLPGEYFMPEKNPDTQEYLNTVKAINNDFYEEDYFDIDQNDGIYVYVDYSDKKKFSSFSDDFSLATCDCFMIGNTMSHYVDCSYVELQKLLRKRGITINSIFPYEYIAFEDLVSNLPLIYHSGINSVQNANITLDAIKELISLYCGNCTERIISFIIGVEYKDKVVTYSMLGNVVDMDSLLKQNISIPDQSSKISSFLNEIKLKNKKRNNRLPINNIKFANGMDFRRELIFRNQFSLSFDDHSLNIGFSDRKIVEYMKKYHLQPAMVNIINKSECINCKKEYRSCDCLKFETGGEEIKDMILIGCVLTRHKA